ncbi:MAG: hypothetical protein WB992_09400 [Bryobacteraceae bacterium]
MSAVLSHRVELRQARFEDYKGIAALESSHGLASKPFDEWRRLWAGNPCYEELGSQWPIGWVLEDGDRIVGCSSNIPLPYVFRGRKLLVAAGRGWVVDNRYRGYAPLLGDEYFNQQNVDVFLNNTVNDKAADLFDTFGSLPAPVGDWSTAAFTITGYRGFAESALRIKEIPGARLLSYPAGVALSLKDSFTAKAIPRSDIDVSMARDFDQRFDTFWERLQERSSTFLAVRSREVLKWHFGPSLERNEIWVLTAGESGKIEAYSVFQRRDEPRYGLKRVRMVDFQAFERHDQYCAALMRRAYDESRAQGIHVLEHVGCDLEKTRVFEEAAPYRRKLPSWSFFYLAKNAELAAQLSGREAWAPSSYDGDSSL